jgi:hypothetical protein
MEKDSSDFLNSLQNEPQMKVLRGPQLLLPWAYFLASSLPISPIPFRGRIFPAKELVRMPKGS